MMLWMMPLMFGWFTLTVPSGLGVYWVATGVVGIILQFFYMRTTRTSLRQVFLPAAAPAAGASVQRHEEEETTEEEPAVVAASGSRSRKRRSHGRRRRKR
jgi:membrane protein insertase Oxa1/YidC/SpoIIIJ